MGAMDVYHKIFLKKTFYDTCCFPFRSAKVFLSRPIQPLGCSEAQATGRGRVSQSTSAQCRILSLEILFRDSTLAWLRLLRDALQSGALPTPPSSHPALPVTVSEPHSRPRLSSPLLFPFLFFTNAPLNICYKFRLI